MSFWNFKNDTQPGEAVTLDIEGELMVDDGWWMPNGAVNAKDFRRKLDQVGDVIVRINSPGGDVLAGAEIYHALREHSATGKGTVTVHVTALAASAASVVAMAGDKILMNPTAYMMIHNPWSVGVGDADDLRLLADQLDEVAEGIIEAYRLKTGKSRAKLREMLDAETYMSAPTAIREGFADGLLYQPEEVPQETEMAARTVAARMVARIREDAKAPSSVTPDGATPSPMDGGRLLEAAKRQEIAKRAEIVARTVMADA